VSAFDDLLELYARQRELQDKGGDSWALSPAEVSELMALPTRIYKAWERRRCEMIGAPPMTIDRPPKRNRWNARLPVYHEKEAAA
jgi:hypothetical protein